MRAVVQRTHRAAVSVSGAIVGEIDRGLCVLLGVGPEDDEKIAGHLASRIATLRIFPDDQGRMNRDIRQAGGQILAISQFTLFADASRGHRPSFIKAAPPELGNTLYEAFVAALRGNDIEVATGKFGEYMEIDIAADGPTTIVLTSGEPGWNADAG